MSVQNKSEAKHTVAPREHPVSQVLLLPPRKGYLQQSEARRLCTLKAKLVKKTEWLMTCSSSNSLFPDKVLYPFT